jgi:triacylglycerol lipase
VLKPRPVPSSRTLIDLKNLFPPDARHEFLAGALDAAFDTVTDAASLCRANAWWLAELAFLAYDDDTDAVRKALKACGVQPHFFGYSRPGTQCLVAAHEHFIAIVFRGSEIEQFQDIFTDLNLPLREAPGGGRAHDGFLDALQNDDCWKEVRHWLDEARNGRPVWFGGHSLGGALAILAAADACRGPHLPNAVYTYGAPKVGDKDFVRSIAGRFPIHQFVHEDDAVPRLPLRPSYEPTTKGYWLHADGDVDLSGPPSSMSSLLSLLLNPLTPFLKPTGAFKGVIDHSPKLYAVKLWNYLAKVE